MKKFTISVILDGQLLKAVSDGTEEGTVFTGSEDHVRRVKKAIRLGRLIDVAGTRRSPVVKAGYDDPLALTAALYSIMPRYTSIWRAPKEVMEFFQWNMNENNGCMVAVEED